MAQFLKVNPVVDCQPGMFFGKAVDFLEINFGATGNGIITSTGPNGALVAVIRQVEQTATIEGLGTLTANMALISYNGSNANVGLRVITSGVNAVNVSTLTSSIQSLGVYVVGNGSNAAPYANVDLSDVTVTSFTF
jgi:hypothetical protein